MSQAGFDAECFKSKDGKQCTMQWTELDKMEQKSLILKVQKTNRRADVVVITLNLQAKGLELGDLLRCAKH